MIKFIEHHEPGYANRTIVNARAADLTICFGVNFKSSGMILTHKSSYGKYFPVNMLYKIDDKLIDELVVAIFDRSPDVINIAGNSLYSMRELMTQEQCNEYVFNVLQLTGCSAILTERTTCTILKHFAQGSVNNT